MVVVRPQGSTAEQVIAAIAATRLGLVTRVHLRDAGITGAEIKTRVRNGSLIREHRGVYRVGHRAPSLETSYLAAVFACGDAAVLSGLAAAHLYGLLRGPAPAPEVTAPTVRRVDGVRTRRSRIDPRDRTAWRQVPITTVPRTLIEIAGALDTDDLARACHEAGIRYRTAPTSVEAALSRCPNARGAAKLRTILRGDVRVTLSKLERAFLARLREAGLPLPQTNRPAGGRRVDCRWPDHRLTVELDSYRYHGSRRAWEQDRRREREAYARGDEFRRYTYGDVVETPQLMLSELRALLTARRAG
jgi:very-short-patch-repair endonuclease